MLADIPPLFGEGMVIPEENAWVVQKGTRCFMQWYGLPAKIIGGVVHRWDKEWIPCDEKTDVGYIDARNCSASSEFIAHEEKLDDGYYFLVGLTTDNPYAFRHPMLIPFDFYEVLYDRGIDPDALREFLMFQPNMFGLLFNQNEKWCYVNGNNLALKFHYEDGKSTAPQS